jgi:hypothetical protein
MNKMKSLTHKPTNLWVFSFLIANLSAFNVHEKTWKLVSIKLTKHVVDVIGTSRRVLAVEIYCSHVLMTLHMHFAVSWGKSSGTIAFVNLNKIAHRDSLITRRLNPLAWWY